MDTQINKYVITITFKHNNYDQTSRNLTRHQPKISKLLKSIFKKVVMQVTKNVPPAGARSAPALGTTSELRRAKRAGRLILIVASGN